MRTIILATALTLTLALTGCEEESFRASSGSGGGEGVSCNGEPIAPRLPTGALVGDWTWFRGIVYEDGRDYDSSVRGELRISADGRWEGERETLNVGMATGPGDWEFDSRTLTLHYDDGTDAETYTGVRVSEQLMEGEDMAPIWAMTLEQADDTGCTVYILRRPRR